MYNMARKHEVAKISEGSVVKLLAMLSIERESLLPILSNAFFENSPDFPEENSKGDALNLMRPRACWKFLKNQPDFLRMSCWKL